MTLVSERMSIDNDSTSSILAVVQRYTKCNSQANQDNGDNCLCDICVLQLPELRKILA